MDVGGRIPRLRQAFGDAGCDALLVTRLVNIRYLTGFTGSAALLLVLGGCSQKTETYTETDSAGAFRVDGLQPGTYALSATIPAGFQPASVLQEVRVGDGANTGVTAKMKPYNAGFVRKIPARELPSVSPCAYGSVITSPALAL